MQKQKFDEIVSYFNKKVSEMEIETKYKMELLGMVTALGYAHEKETHDKRTETHACDFENLPSAQPERLTDDDFETIRIHLNAYKEKLCNQQRWEEAEEYQRIIDRFMAFASAQPEPVCINLNEPIKVKLTDWGKEIYYHQYDRTNQIAGREVCKPNFPKEDEDGYTEFQLWCFMELYGEHIGMTLQNVIEPLEIVYESEKGWKND